MNTLSPPRQLTPDDVERASEQDAKRYELIDGELKEKIVGTEALFIASQITARLNATFYPRVARLNATFYPRVGFAVVETMIYCFDRPNHGRKPDVAYMTLNRFPNHLIPKGDIQFAPNVVVEVLSPNNTGIELEEKLNEYLAAGVPMVWIVNPDRRTIRVYRDDGTTRVFRGQDVIENEPLLPSFRLVVDEVFPSPSPT